MRILVWHVHGSWMTSFVSGAHDYLLPTDEPHGRNEQTTAQAWNWSDGVVDVPLDQLRDQDVDCVVLQRPLEVDLCERWLGRTLGVDVPAVYVEHNAPTGHAVLSRHHVLIDERLAHVPVVHVTRFNAMAWDCGSARIGVVEHGIPDPGPRYTGSHPSVVAVINEPVRRGRVTGTDLLLDFARTVPTHVYGIDTDQLDGQVAGHDNLSRAQLHEHMAEHRAYLHPYRWTSLGLSLLEAMTLGMPVLALSTTQAPAAVPPEAGVLSNDLEVLRAQAGRWMADPAAAAEIGRAARAHALERYGLQRFLDDWDAALDRAVG